MEFVAASSWNRIRTALTPNSFLKYCIGACGECTIAFTDLIAVYVSSIPLLAIARACNPSLTIDSPKVVQHLLQQAIQDCSVDSDNESTAIVTRKEHSVHLHFSTVVAEGVQFEWNQLLYFEPQSNEILRDQFIIPLLGHRNIIPGLPVDQHSPDDDAHHPAQVPSPASLARLSSINDQQIRSERREAWIKKKEEARKRKLMSFQ